MSALRILGGVAIAAIVIAFVLRRSPGQNFGGASSGRGWDEAPQRDSEPPPGHTIKGNISVSSGAKLYHLPGMEDYENTTIDLGRGERWFRTEAEAQASGWRKAGR